MEIFNWIRVSTVCDPGKRDFVRARALKVYLIHNVNFVLLYTRRICIGFKEGPGVL